MKTIKFRAWGPHLNYMWSWEELAVNKISVRWLQPDSGDKVLMQFTDLRDKNGKETYEGDVVKCLKIDFYSKKRFHRCVVIFNEKTASFKFKIIKKGHIDKNHEMQMNYFVDHEVIGNIHENPELL